MKRTLTVLSPPLQQVRRTRVRFGKTTLAYFGGCDYFRLSSHPAILRAMKSGLRKYGLTVAASRSTTGNHELYERLEASLAQFFRAPRAVLLSSGYLGNIAVAQVLAGNCSYALLDERAHASLVDAARFLECPVIQFKHRDVGDVARILKGLGQEARPILLSDGLFSHDGSIAPLKEYLNVLPGDGLILLDDAHAAGLLGKTGKGTIEHAGVNRRQFIQTIALSKAFGVYGGAVLCSEDLRNQIRAKSRLFNGNTPLPLPLASAALKAVQILSSDKSLRTRLFKNTARVQSALRSMGFPIVEHPSPIFALVPSHPAQVPRWKRQFVANGIFPSFIKYPGGPQGGYFRFALSSEHTQEEIDALIQAFQELSARQ